MDIELKGSFIKVQDTLININDISIIRPKSIIRFDGYGKELNQNFPEILIIAAGRELIFQFEDEEKRNEALSGIVKLIAT